mgnify:CR=1 FL=1
MNWHKQAQSWTKGDGNCMKTSADLMLKIKHELFKDDSIKVSGEPFLVHALVYGRGIAQGHRFPHAWVEADGMVYDYSSGASRQIPSELYYILGGVEKDNPGAYRRYSFEEMRKKLLSQKTYGPWDLDESLQEKPAGKKGKNK